MQASFRRQLPHPIPWLAVLLALIAATAVIGFAVTSTRPSGLAVLSTVTTGSTLPNAASTTSLVTAALDALKQPFPAVQSSTTSADPVLSDSSAPAIRIRLGSTAAATDQIAFGDPLWPDNVANGVYKAIASVYGVK